MSHLEDELRTALRRKEPPPGFGGRVLARVAAQRRRRRWREWMVAAAAAVALAAGGLEYRHYQGERARQRVLLAVRIAGSKLHKVQQKIGAAEGFSHSGARIE